MSIAKLKIGERVGIYRKSKLRHTGTLLRKVDANDSMTFGYEMGPEWILTIDIDGLGPRRWAGMFRAKDLRKLGYVSIKPLGGAAEKGPPGDTIHPLSRSEDGE